MPFQRTLKFKYGRVESPNHKSAPKWQNGAIFLGHEKSRVHPCVQPTEPEPTFASSAQASIRPSGRHPSPPLRSRHLRTCSTLAGAQKPFKTRARPTFQDLGPLRRRHCVSAQKQKSSLGGWCPLGRGLLAVLHALAENARRRFFF